MERHVFIRHADTPLIKPADLPLHANGVLNPGVTEADGEVILLLRIENREGMEFPDTRRVYGRDIQGL